MPKNSAVATASGMLSDLKSRLGFSRKEGEYDDGAFDEYDDFDDEGFNAQGDREYAGYGADYDESAPVGAYRPAAVRSSRLGQSDSSPNLVSLDDVKARSKSRPSRTPGVGGRTARSSSGRDLIDDRAPAASSPAYNASLREGARQQGSRSGGLNSLFEPSSSSVPAHSTDASSSYDPYVAYSSASPKAYTSTRGITVVKPVAYADVERVSRALKAGDAVVLAMRNTPDDLSKRVLDFSFGVASALDANVECPAEKVFAIARGVELSEDEKRHLRSQGVL